MRRFTLTLGLALAAGIAIFLAPRLFASVAAPSALFAAPSALVEAPAEIVAVPVLLPAVPEVPMAVQVPRAASQIPELDAPRAPDFVEATPGLDSIEVFWRDCPACGMG